MNVYTTCMPGPCDSLKQTPNSLRLEVTDSCELWRGCWEWNLCLLESQNGLNS